MSTQIGGEWGWENFWLTERMTRLMRVNKTLFWREVEIELCAV
jgi:hypothetical protein